MYLPRAFFAFSISLQASISLPPLQAKRRAVAFPIPEPQKVCPYLGNIIHTDDELCLKFHKHAI